MGEPTGDYWDSINGTGRVRLMTAEQVASVRKAAHVKRLVEIERESDYIRLKAENAAHLETNRALVDEIERLRRMVRLPPGLGRYACSVVAFRRGEAGDKLQHAAFVVEAESGDAALAMAYEVALRVYRTVHGFCRHSVIVGCGSAPPGPSDTSLALLGV
jgi:hypothetical protein